MPTGGGGREMHMTSGDEQGVDAGPPYVMQVESHPLLL
jgi:hypothetical protein